MKISQVILLVLSLAGIFSCGLKSQNQITTHAYFDKTESNPVTNRLLIAVTDEEFLQYGARVAYISIKGDTIIPFDKYAYLGTDTLRHYANVIKLRKDNSYGRWVAIDGHQNTLYDIVPFDNGPDYFHEGLVRAKRNGKVGYANEFGQIVIPCEYDFAWWFDQGKAEVTFNAKVIRDKYDEHTIIESDEWFYIDKSGNKVKNAIH
ncbi:WG repeat-containing protein [Persicobacter diffluens]